MYRDFKYINHIVYGVVSSIKCTLNTDFYEIINFGSNSPVKLMRFVTMLEDILQKKAKIRYLLKPSVDVLKTPSYMSKAKQLLNFETTTNIEEDLRPFCSCYPSYSSYK